MQQIVINQQNHLSILNRKYFNNTSSLSILRIPQQNPTSHIYAINLYSIRSLFTLILSTAQKPFLMIDQPLIYKRYTSQVKNNTILSLKQQQMYSSQQRQEQNIQLRKNSNEQQDNSIIFKPESQRNLQPIVLRKFEEYFKKSTQQNNNLRIFNKILHHNQNVSTLSPKKIQKNLPPTPITTRDLARLISKDQNFVQSNIKNQRKSNVYSSKSKHDQLAQIQPKETKNISIIQETIKDQKMYQNFSNPIHILSTRQRRPDRFNRSSDLTIIINKTFTQNNQKSIPVQKINASTSANDASMMDFGSLKIQSSVLVDRKLVPQTSLNPVTDTGELSKEEELKKSIRTKLISRKKVFQESYRQKIRSRSPSPTKYPIRLNYLQYINPIGKQQFTLYDALKVSITNSMIDQVKINMNGCFFSVYVAEGNNSDLIKAIVRSISGWRVAEIPQVANFVWTQSYRKNLIGKKPKKIIRDQIIEESQTYRSKEKLIDATKSPKSNRFNQTFIVSSNFIRKKSDSNKFLKKKSLDKIDLGSRSKIASTVNESNYTDLSSLKQIKTQQPYSYQNQVKKLLPPSFVMQNFVLKNQKDSKKVTITPNYLIHNHLIGHRAISDKKNLLFNLRKFYQQNHINPFNYIPESHDIATCDDEFILKQNQIYLKEKEKAEVMKKEVWIIKPGEDSNRGRGIIVCKGWEEVVKEMNKRIKQENIDKDRQQDKQPESKQSPQRYAAQKKPQHKKPPRTVILQRYIMPLLYQGRKFDIRSYMLVTWVNNVLNGYVYEECYVRTSSKQFDIDSQNKYVHLTNDAIQSMSHEYGKYEEGNKVSEVVFSKYFDGLQKKESKMWSDMKREMSQRCQHILKSCSKKLVGKFGIPFSLNQSKQCQPYYNESNLLKPQLISMSPQQRAQKIPSIFLSSGLIQKQTEMSFELFGLDFMIDQNQKLWLIEVNTNPAINHDCSRVLGKLIPKLLENTFALAVMPYMRPSRISDSTVYHNQFCHIYQEVIHE